MKGIPVLPNGDPVRKTFVIAGDFSQFGHWCHYSRVNPRSRNIKFLTSSTQLMGVNDCDFVETGTYRFLEPGTRQRIQVLEKSFGEHEWYYQYESCEIEPNVVEC